MPRHKDFEIWYDEERQKYRFSVEYWGAYSATTKKEIEHKVASVRRDVKRKLKEIEIANQKYYKRLAEKEEKMLWLLKDAKNNHTKKALLKFNDLSSLDRKELLNMIKGGKDEIKIKEKFEVNTQTIAALKRRINENVLKDIRPDETLSNDGGSRIIMPAYAETVIGNRHAGRLRDKQKLHRIQKPSRNA